jgi:uncharacterized protein YmfQ (DUF2313 family)
VAGAKLDKYKELFINLLPKGRLWNPNAQPTFLKLITGVVTEFCRVDDRRDDMLNEIDPTKTDEAIDLWEDFLAIPDECTPDGQSIAERQIQIIQKLTNVGGLSKTFYEFIGAQLGFPTVTVKNWVNFVAGRGRAGDPLTNYFDRHFVAGSVAGTALTEIGWLYYFNVDIPVTAATIFVAGSFAGDPLRDFSNELLECTYKKIKPANSGVTFSFF